MKKVECIVIGFWAGILDRYKGYKTDNSVLVVFYRNNGIFTYGYGFFYNGICNGL